MKEKRAEKIGSKKNQSLINYHDNDNMEVIIFSFISCNIDNFGGFWLLICNIFVRIETLMDYIQSLIIKFIIVIQFLNIWSAKYFNHSFHYSLIYIKLLLLIKIS